MFRILAVDDNEEVLRLIRHAATAAGHAVETARSGAEFKDAFLQLRPNVVIVDLQLPDIGGKDIVRWLSEVDHPPRVILISGDPAAARGSLEPGREMEFLPKPFRIAQLLSAIAGPPDRSEAE